MVLLEIKGFVEEDEEPTNVIKKCPKCGSDMWKTDALKLLNQLVVGCKNTRCRYCVIYEL
jgi:hypothetical protein